MPTADRLTMPLGEAIFSLRAIRRLKPDPIPDADLRDILEAAIRGMLPKNSLGRHMIKKLKVYAGPTHPHEAQKPQTLEL